jgi:undecaprenyl-diphosphatase
LIADNFKEGKKNLNTLRAFLIGVSQAIGIIPGISRSGITISTSILLGIKRGEAAIFSFLMVIPLIIGSVIKSILDQENFNFNLDFSILFIGFFTAFFTGIIACKWMLHIVENFKLKYFSFYCIMIGIIALSFG